jgi:hypothetical protein
MYHYDGHSWKTAGYHSSDGGNISGSVELRDIFGFSPSNIWAVGSHFYVNHHPPPNFFDTTLIIHYNGREWNKESIQRLPGMLNCIWGDAPDRMWAGGTNGILYRYNGTSWKQDSIYYRFPDSSNLNIISISGNRKHGYYMTMSNLFLYPNYDEYKYFLKLENDHWIVLDSTRYWVYSWGDIWVSPTGKIFVGGNNLYEWKNDLMETILDEPGWVFDIYGTSEDNIFISGDTPKGPGVYHFNGVDWKIIDEINPRDVLLTGIWTDGKEAFIVRYTFFNPTITLIYHGK